jgi:2-polyprenyl-6-methoxyphenol hydroxylase-like FAD-dependent oxidoreductase
LIGITRSAQRGFLKWPGFTERLLENAMSPTIGFYKYDGFEIATLEDTDTRKEGIQSMALWRSELHQQLYSYAVEVGVPIKFNKTGVKFWDAGLQGGVEFEDGEEVLADLVVAADGVGSQSGYLTVGDPETPTSSGYAIYRASFPVDVALQDPLVKEHWENYQGVQIHLAENCHIVTAKNDKTNRICWMMTHKDIHDDAVENWNATCNATDALQFGGVKHGWAPYIEALIRQTPKNECVNWKLMWRSPREPWHSPEHRVLQIGDACHSFIPTSGSGAVMAIEDGLSLATCLQMAGKQTIPWAVKVHCKFRFERTSFAQKLGFDTREVYHHPSWELFMEKPEAMAVR